AIVNRTRFGRKRVKPGLRRAEPAEARVPDGQHAATRGQSVTRAGRKGQNDSVEKYLCVARARIIGPGGHRRAGSGGQPPATGSAGVEPPGPPAAFPDMKPLTERHLAILRRHMVEIVEMHFVLASDETGERTLGADLRRALLAVPRHLFVPGAL